MASKIPRRSNIASPSKIPKVHVVTKCPPSNVVTKTPASPSVGKVSKIPYCSSHSTPHDQKHDNGSEKRKDAANGKHPHEPVVPPTDKCASINEHECGHSGVSETILTEETRSTSGHDITPPRFGYSKPSVSGSKHATSLRGQESKIPMSTTVPAHATQARLLTSNTVKHTSTSRISSSDTPPTQSSKVPIALGKHIETKVPRLSVSGSKLPVSGIPTLGGDSRISVSGSKSAAANERKLPTSRSNPDAALESKNIVSRSASAPGQETVSSGSQRFETFLMTGEMMIRTSETHCKLGKVHGKETSKIPSLKSQEEEADEMQDKNDYVSDERHTSLSPLLYDVSDERQTSSSYVHDYVSDESQTSLCSAQDIFSAVSNNDALTSDALMINETENKDVIEENVRENCTNLDSPDVREVGAIIELCEYLPNQQLDTVTEKAITSREIDSLHLDHKQVENTEVSLNVCGRSQTSQSSSSSVQDVTSEDLSGQSHEGSPVRNLVISKSDEKLTKKVAKYINHESLRASKSHDNCLENDGFEFRMVDIDYAASYDALHYDSNMSSPSSIDESTHSRSLQYSPHEKITNKAQVSRSLESSPESTNRLSQRVFLHGFIRVDSERETTPESSSQSEQDYEDNVETVLEREFEEKVVAEDGFLSVFGDGDNDTVKLSTKGNTHNLSSPDSEDSDQESLYFHPPKAVDVPSAQRLAKRLFNLEGFNKSDVCKHLSKNNDFAQYVAEDYLSYFDFTHKLLDEALRLFLTQFSLSGETQERERVLAHFSHRYMLCNPGTFKSDDACHTLTCAIMLLNTDLHGQNIGRKMACAEFVDNLSELNDGANFPKDILKNIYTSIKREPIDWAMDECNGSDSAGAGDSVRQEDFNKLMGPNPFLEIPDASKATEYKKGFVMRKCVLDHDGRRTALGKRGWKMFYVCLRDMVLYLYKDEQSCKKNNVHSLSNTIRVHHSIAIPAIDYKKKHNVFRIKTADWAEYLFQTSDPKDLEEWTDCINYVSASLSAPPLAAAVGSQKRFQRPLMPSSYTKLNMREQLQHHECRVLELEHDLLDHQKFPPEKGAKARVITEYTERESYLQFELERFRTYAQLLQAKMATYPELEPTLVETAIGEVEEPPSSPTSYQPHILDVHLRQLPHNSKAVQRSHSDR